VNGGDLKRKVEIEIFNFFFFSLCDANNGRNIMLMAKVNGGFVRIIYYPYNILV